MHILRTDPTRGATNPNLLLERSGEGKFVKILQDLDREEMFVDRLINRTMRRGDFTPQEMIAVQIGVYRYTQKIDLVSKIVDRTVSSIRQVLTPQ